MTFDGVLVSAGRAVGDVRLSLLTRIDDNGRRLLKFAVY